MVGSALETVQKALRDAVGIVLQKNVLFSGTVRENLQWGDPNADDDTLWAACKAACADEFLARMPKGLDTVLREDSVSQGQKQLLCIARVMLCLPPMLILDEATSSIDTRTEILVQQAYETLMEGRTCFVIAHRLSTLRKANKIIVVDQGKIIECGSHEELMALNGKYRRLIEIQATGNHEPWLTVPN